MNLQTLGKSNTRQSIPVWDLFVRVFHWSVVFAFTGAYVLSDDGGALHHAFGYVHGDSRERSTRAFLALCHSRVCLLRTVGISLRDASAVITDTIRLVAR